MGICSGKASAVDDSALKSIKNVSSIPCINNYGLRAIRLLKARKLKR
jgi:hypothetical protein